MASNISEFDGVTNDDYKKKEPVDLSQFDDVKPDKSLNLGTIPQAVLGAIPGVPQVHSLIRSGLSLLPGQKTITPDEAYRQYQAESAQHPTIRGLAQGAAVMAAPAFGIGKLGALAADAGVGSKIAHGARQVMLDTGIGAAQENQSGVSIPESYKVAGVGALAGQALGGLVEGAKGAFGTLAGMSRKRISNYLNRPEAVREMMEKPTDTAMEQTGLVSDAMDAASVALSAEKRAGLKNIETMSAVGENGKEITRDKLYSDLRDIIDRHAADYEDTISTELKNKFVPALDSWAKKMKAGDVFLDPSDELKSQYLKTRSELKQANIPGWLPENMKKDLSDYHEMIAHDIQLSETLDDMLKNSDMNNLKQYEIKRGEGKGTLEEVTGKGKTYFGKRGDNLVGEGGSSEANAIDTEHARELYKNFKEDQEVLKNVKRRLKVNKKEYLNIVNNAENLAHEKLGEIKNYDPVVQLGELETLLNTYGVKAGYNGIGYNSAEEWLGADLKKYLRSIQNKTSPEYAKTMKGIAEAVRILGAAGRDPASIASGVVDQYAGKVGSFKSAERAQAFELLNKYLKSKGYSDQGLQDWSTAMLMNRSAAQGSANVNTAANIMRMVPGIGDTLAGIASGGARLIEKPRSALRKGVLDAYIEAQMVAGKPVLGEVAGMADVSSKLVPMVEARKKAKEKK